MPAPLMFMESPLRPIILFYELENEGLNQVVSVVFHLQPYRVVLVPENAN